MLTGRRFRVEFTDEQAHFAERIASVCRVVWNTGLEQRREYRRRGAWMNYREQAHELADAKTEQPWLGEVPGHCLQQTLMDLDRACTTHGTFRVRWRSGRRWAPSFRFPEGNKMVVEQLNRRHARVKLPKLGWVRFRLSRPLDDVVIRSATLSQDGQHWFVSFLVDDGKVVPGNACPAGVRGWGGPGCGGGNRDQRRRSVRSRVHHHRRAARGQCGCSANCRGRLYIPVSDQDPSDASPDSRAGPSPSSRFLCPDRPPAGARATPW